MILSGKTDIGKRRRENQDSFAITAIEGAILLTVCDGMGGAAGGKTASSSAVEAFTSYIADNYDQYDDIQQLLCDGTAAANSFVYNMACADRSLEGMGTTLVAAIICTDDASQTENAETAEAAESTEAEETEETENTEKKPSVRAYGVNIGDSRLYAVTKQGLNQISHDHSFVQYLIDIGQLTEEEAENNPNRNMIMRAVGTSEEVEADTFVIDIAADGETDGEMWLLLCSDGLTNYLSKDKIASIITDEALTADEKTSALIEGANEGGGGDNITAVIARCL